MVIVATEQTADFISSFPLLVPLKWLYHERSQIFFITNPHL